MKNFGTKLVIAMTLLVSNASSAFADGYGHVPVDTAFELDSKTISALLSIILFIIGSVFVIEGVFFKNIKSNN